MKKLLYALLLCICVLSPLHASSYRKIAELRNCLLYSYHVDLDAITPIVNKFSPVKDQLIEEFIVKSHVLTKGFSKKRASPPLLPENDPVYLAEKGHAILYEDASIRVLWEETQPGEQEPFHKHCWKSLMVIVKGALFEMKGQDQSIETNYWPEGIHELPADTQAYAYKNISSTPFQALRFEFKN